MQKRQWALGMLLVMWLGAVAMGQAAKPAAKPMAKPGGDEAIIRQMEQDWADAMVKRDAKPVARLLAEDFDGINDGGKRYNKADELHDAGSGSFVFDMLKVGDIRVRVFGNTAVVQGEQPFAGKDAGKPSKGTYLFTDVFVKRNGRWWIVASQDMLAPE